MDNHFGALGFVAVNTDPGPATTLLHITVQAGFAKTSTTKESKPTCSETFEWPAPSDSGQPFLQFTENLELAYLSDESKRARSGCNSYRISHPPQLTRELKVIKQNFFTVDASGHVQSTGENGCPYRKDLNPTTNPYYIPTVLKDSDDSKQSNAGADDSFIQPVGYVPSTVASANVHVDDEPDTDPANLIVPSSSSPGKPPTPNFAPLRASTIGANLDTAGSDGYGYDCLVYGCGTVPKCSRTPTPRKEARRLSFARDRYEKCIMSG